jgi:hypothetical protein
VKKADIRLGEAHAVDPGRTEADAYKFGGSWPVKATALEVGVEYDHSGGYGRPNPKHDGVRCRLEEPFRAQRRGISGDSFEQWEPGREFVVPSRLVLRLWEAWDQGRASNDEQRVRDRALRYAQQDFVREAGARLGLGAVELKADEVTIDLGQLVRWLKRVDPAEVARSAIDAFIEEVERHEPFAGLTDLGKRDAGAVGSELDAMKLVALNEVAEGLAVSDADIEPEGGPQS